MVGRLARYLRFVGCDTVYARGMDDADIEELARTDGRVLVTRDQALARRTPGSILLESPSLGDQWLSVRAALPELPGEVRFVRCSECNGALNEFRPGSDDPRPEGVPWDRVDAGLTLYRCEDCHHLYWEGTHTERIRAQLRAWAEGRPA
jgi:uncharacterized protein